MVDTRTTRFAHQRLDVYHVALELFRGVEQVAATLPHGHAELKDQLRRAAGATVRNIAEGANRMHARDQVARFNVARGECGECEAALEMVHPLHRAGAARRWPSRSRRSRRRNAVGTHPAASRVNPRTS